MTESIIIVVIGIVVIALTSSLAPRLGIAGPLILVAIGLVVSLLPFVKPVFIQPEYILVGVLPPLLYSSAVSLPAIEFRRDFRPIAGLSVVLVLVSAAGLGFFFNAVIPGLGLPLSFALGAILSPTDAVATTIVKRLGISPRVVTLVEGESLLNDATALVLLRTAVAAAVVGSITVWDAIGEFAWGVAIAIVIGAIVGNLNLRVRERISNSAANTAISFTVPFIAYIPTELLGGSGLVAAVVAGIVTGQGAARRFTAEQRMSDTLNWRTIELVLEGAVFLLMGLELKDVFLANLRDHEGIGRALWLAGVALLIVLAVRAGYVAVLLWRQGRRARRVGVRERLDSFQVRLDQADATPGPDDALPSGRGRPRRPMRPEQREPWMATARRRLTRSLADLDYYQASPLGWRHGTIVVWAGMRGVVTLAAAQTLPDNPLRALLVFVAFLVAVGGLLIQGLTLAPLARALGLVGSGGSGPTAEEQRTLDAKLQEAAASALQGPGVTRRDGTQFPPGLVERVGARYTTPPDDDTTAIARDLLELRFALIEAMRDRLTELSSDGTFSTAALRHALAELDADEMSIRLRLDDVD